MSYAIHKSDIFIDFSIRPNAKDIWNEARGAQLMSQNPNLITI